MQPHRPREIIVLFPIGILSGAALGAFTYAINDWISPEYFLTMTGEAVPRSSQIWVPTLTQGLSKGAILGAISGLILMLAVGFISHLRSPLKLSASTLIEAMAFTLLFWIIGGFNGILLALFVPQFYDLFLGLPASMADIINFAWVEGSVAGVRWGGLLAVCLACVRFSARWKQRAKAAENENFDFSK